MVSGECESELVQNKVMWRRRLGLVLTTAYPVLSTVHQKRFGFFWLLGLSLTVDAGRGKIRCGDYWWRPGRVGGGDLLAESGLSVAVVEQKSFPRCKVCGEYLS